MSRTATRSLPSDSAAPPSRLPGHGHDVRLPSGDRLDGPHSIDRAIRPLSVRANFFCNCTGNVVFAVSRWGWLVVLAKLGNANMIGLLVLATAVCAPVVAIANLGLRNSMITDAKREYRFGDYLGLRLVSSVIAFLVIVAVIAVMDYAREAEAVILVIAVAKFFESVSDVCYGYLQQQERMDRIAVSLCIREPLALVAMALGVYATGSLLLGALAIPCVFAATLLLYDLRQTAKVYRAEAASRTAARATVPLREDRLRPCWHVPTLLRLAWLTVPLGVVMMLISLIISVPRYMVGHYLGAHALGIFGAITALAAAGIILVSAMGNSASPRLAKYFIAGKRAAFVKLVAQQMGLIGCFGSAAVLTVMLFGRPILQLMYDAEIAAHTRLAVALTLASAIVYFNGPLGRALDAMRRFVMHMVIRVLALAVLLSLLPGYIAAWGMEGAAAAMIAAALFTTLAYAVAIGSMLRRFPSTPCCDAADPFAAGAS